jgi:hypothetical protein
MQAEKHAAGSYDLWYNEYIAVHSCGRRLGGFCILERDGPYKKMHMFHGNSALFNIAGSATDL